MRMLLPLSLLPPLVCQAPEFVDGRVTDLRCRVTSASPTLGDSTLCEVEVRNSGEVSAEPLVFRIVAGKDSKPRFVERAPAPHAARWGRGVAPRSSREFWVQLRGSADARSVQVAVERAAFYRGAPQQESPVTVGRLEATHAQLEGERVRATAIALRNTATAPLDAVLRVTYETPAGAQGLVTARLQAGEQRDHVCCTQPLELEWDEPAAMPGARITRAEVVDWTTLQPDEAGTAQALAVLQAAYERWARWPEPRPACAGTFTALLQRQGEVDGRPQPCEGRFRLQGDAPVLLEFAREPAAELRQRVERAVGLAFADLRRPAFDALAKTHRLIQQERGVVGFDGPPPDWSFGDTLVVADQAIRGTRLAAAEHAIHQRWSVRDEGGGYVVIGRDTVQTALGADPSEVERRTYTRQGKWVVPVSLRVETRYPATGYFDIVQLTLSCEPPQVGPVADEGPTGAGADALRAAWESGYVYPDRLREFSARFEARNAGTDEVWLGQRKLDGTVRLGGFRGFRTTPAGWSDPQVGIDGKARSPGDAARLAAALVDRLWMWAGRDFAGRLPFAQAFRGARIEPASDGLFRVTASVYDEVEVRDGLVVRLREAGGRERRFEWKRVGGHAVAVRITTGREVLSATWQALGADWLLPVELRFERVFGDDWGPESIRLRGVTLRD